MPLIKLNIQDLKTLIDADIQEILKNMPMLGSDIDHVDENEIHVEFFPDRPDLYSVEGIARALKGFMEIETGLPKYEIHKSDMEMKVDKKVEKVRPYIASAVIKNIHVDDLFIKSIMDFQEKIHLTYGRKRKKVAVGIHDLDKISSPFLYTTAKPEEVSFVPLGLYESMTLKQILEKHPKGIEYAHILENKEEYPIIFDSQKKVISLPPIINGILTQVTEQTKNLLIEITGTDKQAVNRSLNIFTTAFADRGGEIFEVRVDEVKMPNLDNEDWEISVEKTNKILGLSLESSEIVKNLEKMRFCAKAEGNSIKIKIPPYRVDILNDMDILEDVAKGYGYWKFSGTLPEKVSFSKPLRSQGIVSKTRKILIGLGFHEITTLTLTSSEKQFSDMNIDKKNSVEIKNPIGEEYNTLRTWLIPSLLSILNKNKHRNLPQKIFEISNVINDKKQLIHLAMVSTHPKASFTEMKSLAESILHDLSIKYQLEPCEMGCFISGRSAKLLNSEEIGIFGEIHPNVIENFELTNPIIGLEIILD